MLDPRRTLSQLRRTRNRAVVRARRHPRISVGIFTAVAVTVAVVGSLAILNSRGPGAASVAPVTSPFTYAGSWSLIELQRHIEAGEVATITANSADTTTGQGGGLLVRTTTGQVVSVDLEVTSAEAVNALRALGYGDLLTTEALAVSRPPSEGGNNPLTIILPLTMMVLTLILVLRISRRGNPAQRDASNFKTIMPTARPPDGVVPEAAEGAILAVRLDDVAGCDEAKLELTEAIEFLKSPERFHKLGARIPRGIMLYGPPGTGKTMLARAVAAEAGVPFHHASGSEFVEKYVGVGARRIRDLFAQARKLGRGVIFFDEFDAIGKARGGPNSHEEREQTLNQLLVELDGFATTEDIIVIAATNRLDTLDPAVLRPGRFNRKIHVGLPDVKGRQEILAVHARNKPIDPSVDLEDTARKTYGFSGAMLADLLNEGAILAARRASEVIAPEDLHGGWLKVAVGTSRRRSMDERERSIIAAHEVGHAICGKVHGDKRKVEEISLFAHGEALGVTVSSQEDNDLPSETDLRARLVALMGGRAAEELLFHEVTGGASNDFEAANKIATAMVTRWGMGRDPDATDHGISGRGTLSFLVPAPGVRNLPSDVQSAATRAISAILDESYAEACRTLVEHMETLRRLASYLVEHERVDGDTFDELFDGRWPVPNSGDEWRAATARPRAWGDVVDLAAHRVRTIPVVAAAIALPAPEPAPAVASVVTPATDSAPVDITPALAPSPISATTATATVPRRRRSVVRRLTRGPVASRRLRHAAAGLLEKAQNWLRATEPEGGQL